MMTDVKMQEFFDAAILKLKQKVEASFARWCLGILVTIIVITATAAFAWSDAKHQITEIQEWKNERQLAVKEYEAWRRQMSADMAELKTAQKGSIEKQQDTINLLAKFLDRAIK